MLFFRPIFTITIAAPKDDRTPGPPMPRSATFASKAAFRRSERSVTVFMSYNLYIQPAQGRFDIDHSPSLYSGPFMNQRPHVAVVGATGAVGIEIIKTLARRNFALG